MNTLDLVGQTLDEKYKIERELGRGGMGAVYLATHLGTERAVAVKVIAPEFMRRAEFVERFRREARAAGRLRHPNVVDVTDFGIAETRDGKMAYLVMEYLDGCTLGEVLEEEKRLPLSWSLDILEQTCAAVDEAHRQGIIHRDLKPDNIWLEPNTRGGYTVKVLDFGIAKLEESAHDDESAEHAHEIAPQRFAGKADAAASTLLINQTTDNSATLAMPFNAESDSVTLNFAVEFPLTDVQNRETLALLPDNEFASRSNSAAPPLNENQQTILFDSARRTAIENHATAIIETEKNSSADQTNGKSAKHFASQTTADRKSEETASSLTRVGAVLGTPLYMSPEQCRGDRLDPRTDVYSLGIIAYQLLSGATPFSGKYTDVLKAHQELEPPPLDAKKVPVKVKKVIAAALSKSREERPATPRVLASKLRSNSEGIGSLLRRALVVYSEHLPLFLGFALLFQIPIVIITICGVTARLLEIYNVISPELSGIISVLAGLGSFVANIFFGSILTGITTWLTVQLLAVPLRPVKWKVALMAARKNIRSFAGTVTVTNALTFLGIMLGVIPGAILLGIAVSAKSLPLPGVFITLAVLLMTAGVLFGLSLFVYLHLVAPVVIMENLRGSAALRRSWHLVRRAPRTVAAAVFLNFFLPMILAGLIQLMASALVKSDEIFKIDKSSSAVQINLKNDADKNAEAAAAPTAAPTPEPVPLDKEQQRRQKASGQAWQQLFFEILWFPMLLLLISYSSVVTGLLYLKTRQAGGESLGELLTQFEENDRTQKRWQLRLKNKLEQSGRHHPSRST